MGASSTSEDPDSAMNKLRQTISDRWSTQKHTILYSYNLLKKDYLSALPLLKWASCRSQEAQGYKLPEMPWTSGEIQIAYWIARAGKPCVPEEHIGNF